MSEQQDPDLSNGSPPDPEFVRTPRKRRKGGGNRRRNFTAKYKLAILAEVDAAKASGESVAAIHRREGLYSSHISKWRQQRDAGAFEALNQKRGRKPDPEAEHRRTDARRDKEIARLNAELAKARAIIEVQKKLCEMLELDPSPENS